MAGHPKRRRRIMRALMINEISGVDVPAQEGATVTIMKRKGEPGYDPKAKDPKKRGRFVSDETADTVTKGAALTTAEEGHAHLVALLGPPDGVELLSGFTSFQDGHGHPWIMTETGEIVIGAAQTSDGVMHTHEIDQVSKAEDGLSPKSTKSAGLAGSIGNEEGTTMPDKETAKTGLDGAAIEALTKRLDRAEKRADLNDVEKAYFAALEGDKAQDAFLAKTVDDRKAEIAKAAPPETDDPVIYTTLDGVELHKSADPAFVAVTKSNDVLRAQLEKANQAVADAAVLKRAEALDHIPGDIDARVEMLKAMDGIKDPAKREAALAALKAQNTAMGSAFATAGVISATPAADSPGGELDSLAKSYAKDNNVSEAVAYDKVLETDAGNALYTKMVN